MQVALIHCHDYIVFFIKHTTILSIQISMDIEIILSLLLL